MAEPLYIQLTWEDPQTGEIQQPILAAPIAIGREKEQMPEYLGEQSVSRLELVDKQISRFHTLITVASSQMYITDKSANGTFLNGQQLSKGSQPFSSKDTIRIGPYKITATLMGDGDLNATELTRDRSVVAPMSSALPKNPLLIWFLGGVVLLLMGLGGWLLVSTLLNKANPQMPENREQSSGNS